MPFTGHLPLHRAECPGFTLSQNLLSQRSPSIHTCCLGPHSQAVWAPIFIHSHICIHTDTRSKPASCQLPPARLFSELASSGQEEADSLPAAGRLPVPLCMRGARYKRPQFVTLIVYGHTTLNLPHLVRSGKSSNVGPGQYLDG